MGLDALKWVGGTGETSAVLMGGTPKQVALSCVAKTAFLAAPAQNATWVAGCQVAGG